MWKKQHVREFKQAPIYCQEREVWLLNTWGLGGKRVYSFCLEMKPRPDARKKKRILVSLNRAAFINFHLIYLRKFNYSVIFLVLFNSRRGTMGKRWGLRDLLRRLYCRKDELIFLPLRPSLLACPLHQQLPEVPEGGGQDIALAF